MTNLRTYIIVESFDDNIYWMIDKYCEFNHDREKLKSIYTAFINKTSNEEIINLTHTLGFDIKGFIDFLNNDIKSSFVNIDYQYLFIKVLTMIKNNANFEL